MTVNTTVIKDQYSCNGVLTSFAFTFKCWQTSEVRVILRDSAGTETVLTETVHYTVTINSPTPNTGQIDTVETYGATYTLTLVEILPLTQLVDWGEGDRFPAASHEEAADRAGIKDQQMQEKFSRALLLPESTALADLEFPEPEASKVLGWNAAATELENQDLVALGNLTAHEGDTTSPHGAYESLIGIGKNLIINPNGQVGQRVTAGDLTGAATGVFIFGKADRFEGAWAGTACTAGTLTNSLNPALYDLGGWMGIASATVTGSCVLSLRQRVEAGTALLISGGSVKVSLQFKTWHNTGAARSLVVTINSANATDDFSAVTNIYTSAVQAIAHDTVTSVKLEGLSLGDVSDGFEVTVALTTGAITTKSWVIGDIQLERNDICTDLERRSFGLELVLCQRYYQKSYDYGTAVATATQTGQALLYISALANAASDIYLDTVLRPSMRVAPTVRLWDAAGAVGKVNCVGVGTAGTVSEQTTRGFWVLATMSAGGTLKQLSYHWDADAEF